MRISHGQYRSKPASPLYSLLEFASSVDRPSLPPKFRGEKEYHRWVFWDKSGRKIKESNYKVGDLVDKTIFKYTYLYCCIIIYIYIYYFVIYIKIKKSINKYIYICMYISMQTYIILYESYMHPI